MDFRYNSLEETIYPIDSIWQKLFIPIKDNKGYMYKAVKRKDPAEIKKLTEMYSHGSQTMVLPICFENQIYRKMPFSDDPKEREWTEIPCDNAHIVELGKIKLDAYISSDGHSRTRWDNKRKEIYRNRKNAVTKASSTDYTDKRLSAPSPITEALQIINSRSELCAEGEYNRLIEAKNKPAVEKLINQAFTKKIISRKQYDLLKHDIEINFNK